VNERRTVVGGGLIGHCVSPQPWREIDAHARSHAYTKASERINKPSKIS